MDGETVVFSVQLRHIPKTNENIKNLNKFKITRVILKFIDFV